MAVWGVHFPTPSKQETIDKEQTPLHEHLPNVFQHTERHNHIVVQLMVQLRQGAVAEPRHGQNTAKGPRSNHLTIKPRGEGGAGAKTCTGA